MRKLSITTIGSIALNVLLTLWLVNQYFYDSYFHAYVDSSLGPVYPFIVLTAGLGGGSSLGYLLLRRRHSGDASGKLQQPKLFKPSGSVQSPGSLSSSQGKIMPTGPPPGQVSRHTAYAVPPLPKSSPSTGSLARGTASSSFAASSKMASPPNMTSQRLDQLTQPSTSTLNSTLRDQFRPEQIGKPSPIPSSSPVRGETSPPMNRIPPEPSRFTTPQQWKPEPSPSSERRLDSGTGFARPNLDNQKPASGSPDFGSPVGQVPKPPQPSQTPFPVSKWVPPEQRASGQWTDPVPKPGLAAPQKWGPPPSQGVGPRPSPQGGPPRPGAGPGQGPPGQRPPFPPGQGPRPLGYPSPPRQGEQGPIGVPRPFRPDQPRPTGPPPQGRPMQPMGGPTPQPWSPPRPVEKGEPGSAPQDKDISGIQLPRQSQPGASEVLRQPDNKTPEQSTPGGEMDWDTALDTILKTLKKDRGVGDRP